jgi:prepilin-type processing-associated H-X9-DG protein
LLVGGDTAVDGFYSASKNHPDGAIVAFCDGSVSVITTDVDVGDQKHPVAAAEELGETASHYGVWGALGSANGSEDVADRF